MKIEPFGTTTDEEIDKLQGEFGFAFPSDYREFLKENNGGIIKNYQEVWVPYLKETTYMDGLFGIDTDPGEKHAVFDLRYMMREMSEDIKALSLLIGRSQSGALFVLECSEEGKGVYLYDRNYFHAKTTKKRQFHKIADTFGEFVAMIKPVEKPH